MKKIKQLEITDLIIKIFDEIPITLFFINFYHIINLNNFYYFFKYSISMFGKIIEQFYSKHNNLIK